jgi:hypothetical protein
VSEQQNFSSTEGWSPQSLKFSFPKTVGTDTLLGVCTEPLELLDFSGDFIQSAIEQTLLEFRSPFKPSAVSRCFLLSKSPNLMKETACLSKASEVFPQLLHVIRKQTLAINRRMCICTYLDISLNTLLSNKIFQIFLNV